MLDTLDNYTKLHLWRNWQIPLNSGTRPVIHHWTCLLPDVQVTMVQEGFQLCYLAHPRNQCMNHVLEESAK
ncbi:hypothetical protein GN956_G10098 [Arapaima gigas]